MTRGIQVVPRVVTGAADLPGMRIAIFSEVYWPMVSGVALTLKRTADALTHRGHRVRVYSATYPGLGTTEEEPAVHQSPSRPFYLSPQVQWATPHQAAIQADLADFAPDVVHLATEFAMGVAGWRAARRLGRPMVASAHTDYERYAARYGMAWALPAGWTYLRWFYGQATRVLAPSLVFEAHLRSRGVRHTGIWSRGVDTDHFSPKSRSAAYRERLGLGPTDRLVAYVGRLAPEKGLDRLLEAWPTVARLHPDTHLAITGEGQLADAIGRSGIPRLHLTGPKAGLELSVAYASADVFVMPSTTETFGNVTLEAMASGVAPLAVAAGGVLDFGRHGENCWLVGPDDCTGLVTGLDRLLADTGLRERLARGARATALARGWDPVFDTLLAHYEAAIESRQRVRAA